MNLYTRFDFFLQEEFHIDSPQKILIAVSGGVDSMVLLHLFQQTQHDIAVAHCNYGLRGEESEGDHTFVRDYCEKHHITFFEKRFQTVHEAENNKTGIQETARKLRYNWFSKLTHEHRYDFVTTAHHLNDVTETLLFNITRGSGIAGLHGIPSQNGNTIRPLLFAKRQDIEDYAAEHQLAYRHDSSNDSNSYSRNKIRNQVVPVLKEINPALEEHIKNLTGYMSFVEAIYRKHIAEVFEDCCKTSGGILEIDIDRLLKLDHSESYLFEFVYPFGFNAAQVSEMMLSLWEQSGKQFLSDTHILIKDRNSLLITSHLDRTEKIYTLDATTTYLSLDSFSIKVEHLYPNDTIPFSSSTFFMDADLLSFPLTLRKWKEGDKFTPLGMTGSKKVSDFFIDEKISLIDKQRSWLVCTSKGEIACVLPYRGDNRFKLSSSTKKILKLSIRLRRFKIRILDE